MLVARKEDQADLWLREHDPYYTDKSGHKSKSLLYPYDTVRMELSKARVEIPISNLNSSQKVQFGEIAGAFDENGNFEL